MATCPAARLIKILRQVHGKHSLEKTELHRPDTHVAVMIARGPSINRRNCIHRPATYILKPVCKNQGNGIERVLQGFSPLFLAKLLPLLPL